MIKHTAFLLPSDAHLFVGSILDGFKPVQAKDVRLWDRVVGVRGAIAVVGKKTTLFDGEIVDIYTDRAGDDPMKPVEDDKRPLFCSRCLSGSSAMQVTESFSSIWSPIETLTRNDVLVTVPATVPSAARSSIAIAGLMNGKRAMPGLFNSSSARKVYGFEVTEFIFEGGVDTAVVVDGLLMTSGSKKNAG